MWLSPVTSRGDAPLKKGDFTMNKKYTLDDFRMNTYAYEPIAEDGRFCSSTGKFEINYSSVLTRLIQEAGRFCERFASDLFIDWDSVLRWINELVPGATEGKAFLFGFRMNGVDGNSFVLSRYNGGSYAYPEKEYRSMWRLEVRAENNNIGMTLGRVF